MATGADADGQGTSLLAAAWSDAGASVWRLLGIQQHRAGPHSNQMPCTGSQSSVQRKHPFELISLKSEAAT